MRVNLIGFTSGQSSGENRKNVIGIANTMKKILLDNGHKADYGLENPDINIVSVIDLTSLNAKNVVNCFDILANEKCIIMFDDWNIKQFYKTVDRIVRTGEFSKTHHTVDYKVVLKNIDVIKKLANGEFNVIYPAYRTGNHDLLEIRGKKFCVDPSIYTEKEKTSEPSYLMPVHASLASKWNILEKKKYSILNLRGEKEDTVFDYYCKHRIVITPPHYHDESGWYRNRFSLANLAGAVIVEDYQSVFGDSYKIERKDVTERNIDQLFALQDAAYNRVIMSKEEIGIALKEALESI